MLLPVILTLGLGLGSPASEVPAESKLPWFEGTFEQLLAKAKAEEKIIFLDFWTDWCEWCKRLELDTLSSGPVVDAMADILCYSVDAESALGRPLAKRFGVAGFPTMLFLNPDGRLRDSLDGYFPPDAFVAEIIRIESDEGTINELRRSVAQNADETGALYELILRLESHSAGEAARLRAKLKRHDPDGRTPSARRFTLDRIIKSLEFDLRRSVKNAERPLEEFLSGETLPAILFRGHSILVRVFRFQAQVALEEDRSELRSRELASNRLVWLHCPLFERVRIGNNIAWELWNLRASLSPAYRAFALEVVRESARQSEFRDLSLLETLACCLQMNGELQAALETLDRCMELDPDNDAWPQRRKQLLNLGPGSQMPSR